jgi:hypothetical protein
MKNTLKSKLILNKHSPHLRLKKEIYRLRLKLCPGFQTFLAPPMVLWVTAAVAVVLFTTNSTGFAFSSFIPNLFPLGLVD